MDKARLWYRAWRYRLKLEREEVSLLRDTLGAGDTALDIGAHKGAMSWWMSKAVGPAGAVHAFEPQPVLASKLRTLLDRPRFRNVRVENLGVSDAAGTLVLHVPPGGPSPSATFNAAAGIPEGAEHYEVPVTTVDDWARDAGLERITLIKCDVEGHELAVFRGAIETLRDHRPALLFECEQRHQADQPMTDVFQFLQDLGYVGHCIAPDQLIPVDEFDLQVHQVHEGPFGYLNNFWFTHPNHG